MSYSVKGKPFVFKGVTDVEHCKTASEVISEAGLDWTVAKCELVAKMPAKDIYAKEDDSFIHCGNMYRDCPNSFATYRTDANIPLGIVKDRYTPVQNIEAFKFFDDAIGKDKAIWQTAGCFGNGERVFVSAKLPNNIRVDGDVVENYLVFTTNHDGGGGVKILFTPIRIVCQNTLNAAIANSTNYVSFRHTASVHENINTAHEILGISKVMTEHLEEAFNQMKRINIKDDLAYQIFAKAILTENEYENVRRTGHTFGQIIARDWKSIDDTGISMKKVNTLTEINNYYHYGVGQKEILGTGWGIYNAFTGYYSNVDNISGSKRMDSLLYSSRANRIKRVGDLILDL